MAWVSVFEGSARCAIIRVVRGVTGTVIIGLIEDLIKFRLSSWA